MEQSKLKSIVYIDRLTHKQEEEKVYGGAALRFLYGDSLHEWMFGAPIRHLVSRVPFFSKWYGYLQSRPSSRKKIAPFIRNFSVDTSDFLESPDSFRSFNDFFIRKLKPEARPLAPGKEVAIIPADGRYYFYSNISEADGFIIKGQKFQLSSLLENPELAAQYEHGSLVIARLCPSDYHRYHFPCDCHPGETALINGWLYSVNPIAIKRDLEIFTQNKRTVCHLKTDSFGEVLYLEIGATYVGSIHETYTPGIFTPKGAEKGYFSFGASSLILLFPPNSIQFDSDLLAATQQGLEIKCLMGQSMGTKN